MTGGGADHDTIATNLVAELRERLRNGPWREPQGEGWTQRTLESVRAYVFVDQDKPRVLIYTSDIHGGMGSASSMFLAEGLDAMIEMPILKLTMPLRAVYECISFDE